MPAIAATLPPDIKESGRLTVGVNVPYAPNEFKNSAGDIVGFDVDLINAVSKTLGLLPEYREFLFEDIIPTVQRGEINVGMSSFTDTLERQEQVDFVTYYEAGTLWAQRTGSNVDPNAACGLRIGMTPGSTHETVEVPAKSDQCVAAGLPPVEAVVYPRQDELTAAVINGEIDAMSADSPVTGFAIKGSNGALEPAGEIFDTAPYGWPVQKDSPLGESHPAGARACDLDRRVQDDRHQMGRGERHDRQAGDQRRDQLTAPQAHLSDVAACAHVVAVAATATRRAAASAREA